MNNHHCNCVPSGMCHSRTLAGCPHKHNFNEKGQWVCDEQPSIIPKPNNPLFSTKSHNQEKKQHPFLNQEENKTVYLPFLFMLGITVVSICFL